MVILVFELPGTLEKREHFCQQEVELNSRLAPGMYLQVIPLRKNMIDPSSSEEQEEEYAVRIFVPRLF